MRKEKEVLIKIKDLLKYIFGIVIGLVIALGIQHSMTRSEIQEVNKSLERIEIILNGKALDLDAPK